MFLFIKLKFFNVIDKEWVSVLFLYYEIIGLICWVILLWYDGEVVVYNGYVLVVVVIEILKVIGLIGGI